MVKKLVTFGADVNKTDEKFNTCLQAAYRDANGSSGIADNSLWYSYYLNMYGCFVCFLNKKQSMVSTRIFFSK